MFYLLLCVVLAQSCQASLSLVIHPNTSLLKQRTSNIDDTINQNPGALITGQGVPGMVKTVRYRGINEAHTPIFLNGVPIRNSFIPSFDFTGLLPSSLHIGPTIHLTIAPLNDYVRTEYGSFNSSHTTAQKHMGTRYNGVGIRINTLKSNGMPIYGRRRLYGEKYKREHTDGILSIEKSSSSLYAKAFVFISRSQLKYDGWQGPFAHLPPKPTLTQGRQFRVSSFSLEKKHPQISYGLHIAHTADITRYTPTYKTRLYSTYAKAHIHKTFINGSHIHAYTDMKKDVYKTVSKRFLFPFYNTGVQYTFGMPKNYTAKVGIHAEHTHLYKYLINYNLSIEKHISSLCYSVTYAYNTHHPNPNYLLENIPYYTPNPKIKPEKVSMWSSHIAYEQANTSIAVGLFHIMYMNKIYAQQTPSYTYIGINNKVPTYSYGTEICIHYMETLKIIYTLLKNYKASGALKHSTLPTQKLYIKTHTPCTENLFLETHIRWISGKNDQGRSLASYIRVGAKLQYYLNKETSLYLKANNIFGERYWITTSYRTPRQELYVGFQKKF